MTTAEPDRGSPQVAGLARTRDEAQLFLDLRPCERCGSVDMTWESALVFVDGRAARSYFATCPACGLERKFTFWAADARSLPARTAAEAQVFLALLPCERCTATETDWDHGALFFLDDGGRAENYVGRCDRCGNVREVAFALPDPADGAGGSRFGGPEPSRLLDPAEWMRLAGTVELAPGAARRSGEQAT